MNAFPSRHRGLSFVELIASIAIVAVLLALSLPAIQRCREAARAISCRNNLRQIALAMQEHEGLHGHLPTGGWGWRWHGDPDRGFGTSQPGGWLYNLLPFLEQSHLHDAGAGLAPSAKFKVLAATAATPLAVVACPSRRPPRSLPFVHSIDFLNIDRPALVARSDYSACSGDKAPDVSRGKGRGPTSLAQGESPAYRWLDTQLKGIVFRRSTIRFADLIDGQSNTYSVGEKNVAQLHYFSGIGQNDDQSMLVGFDSDTLRTTDPQYSPRADKQSASSDHAFGSAHPSAFNMAMVDGSVSSVSYQVDAEVHRARGTRWDRPSQVR